MPGGMLENGVRRLAKQVWKVGSMAEFEAEL